jgi:hypothetical protein
VELRDRKEWLRANYPYARPYAYPVVLLLSPFFPQITNVQHAMLLFYLCRVVAAVAVIAVLFAASRRHDLPFTTLTFFSLPLLLQQSAVISVDVFLNLGALACMLLYVSLRERPRKLGLLALWALTLSIVGVKFVYAPVLALPVLALPQGPARRRLMIGAAVAAAVLAYPAALLVLREVRAMGATMGRADETALQLASLATISGWTDLLGLYLRYLETLLHARAWSGPLGWLDAPLSQPHLSLIRASAATAVLLDAWRYAPDVIALLRTRPRAGGSIILLALAALFFVTFADVLLFFLMTTSPGAPAVSGVQARHFFPVAIVVVLLPLLLLPRVSADESAPLRACAWVILPGLLAARTVFLAQDLLVRYW